MMITTTIRLAVASLLPLVVLGDLTSTQRGFADDLTSELYGKNGTTNQCTSSLGVSMAFSLVYPSMIGDSKDQVQQVFGFPSEQGVLVWNETTNVLNAKYAGQCLDPSDSTCQNKNPTVSISNTIWVDSSSGRTLNPDYNATVQDFVRTISFVEEGAGAEVNAWVKRSSRDLIDSIVQEGPLYPPLILLAVNVIYLKANWVHTFLESKTSNDIFYKEDRQTIARDEALFMHQDAFLRYSNEAVPGFQIVRLPFLGSNSALSMILAVPTSATSGMMNSATILEALPNLQNQRIVLAFPKFEFELTYSESLVKSIQQLGITAPFEGGLCVYDGNCGAFISFIIQKTFISVDEKGVEASAVTAIGVAESAPIDSPIEVLANLPFQFFIYDQMTQLVLFEGIVADPVPPQDAPVAQLTAKHTDPNFWEENLGVPDVVVVPFNEGPMPSMNPETPSPETPSQVTPSQVTPSPETPSPETPSPSTVSPTKSQSHQSQNFMGLWLIAAIVLLLM